MDKQIQEPLLPNTNESAFTDRSQEEAQSKDGQEEVILNSKGKPIISVKQINYAKQMIDK
jgi:hypothetical protein